GLRRRWVLLANAVVAVPAPAQSDIVRVTPIIDNERVTVWDITLSHGQSRAFRRHENDFVTMFLAERDCALQMKTAGPQCPSANSVKSFMAARERSKRMRSFREVPRG